MIQNTWSVIHPSCKQEEAWGMTVLAGECVSVCHKRAEDMISMIDRRPFCNSWVQNCLFPDWRYGSNRCVWRFSSWPPLSLRTLKRINGRKRSGDDIIWSYLTLPCLTFSYPVPPAPPSHPHHPTPSPPAVQTRIPHQDFVFFPTIAK